MVKTSTQLKFWTGKFGEDYWKRNKITPEKTENGIKAYKEIFDNIKPKSILEVGSNIGIQLTILRKLLGSSVKLCAVEPNKTAFTKLTNNPRLKLTQAYNCDGYRIPLGDNSVDLVFTSGVLIHIPPRNLLDITKEIVRVSKRYVLCIEFFSHEPEEKAYRGHRNVFFKRDFGAYYLDHFPILKTVDYGFLWERDFPQFMDYHWWLFEKNSKA